MRDLYGRPVTPESKWPQMVTLLRQVFDDPEPNENVIDLQDSLIDQMLMPVIAALEHRLAKLEGRPRLTVIDGGKAEPPHNFRKFIKAASD